MSLPYRQNDAHPLVQEFTPKIGHVVKTRAFSTKRHVLLPNLLQPCHSDSHFGNAFQIVREKRDYTPKDVPIALSKQLRPEKGMLFKKFFPKFWSMKGSELLLGC